MDKLILLLALISLNSMATAQDEEKRNLYYGNSYFDKENYDEAIFYYQEAIAAAPLSFKPQFNMANAYFRKGDFEKAQALYESIVELAPTDYDKSRVYHNLGNTHMYNQKLDDAIDAYKSALRLNPLDEETRYNLAYALFLKQEQEKQEEQNQDQNNEDENNDGENNEGQNGSENQDENGNPQDENENGDENDEDKNEGDENEGESNDSENEKNDKGNKSAPSKISKEQAKRILDAAYKREKEIQKLIETNKKVGEGTSSKKDW